MANPVPTLSTAGWVTELSEKADRVMAYFFVSEFSQTALYPGGISSLPYLVATFGETPLKLIEQLQNTMSALLQRYFDQAHVTVDYDIPDPQSPSRYNVTVDATVVEGKYRYSVGKLISTLDSKVLEIININNG